MMKTVNKVLLIGNVTRDPELRQTEGNYAVCTFGLATNKSRTGKTGEKQENAEFHRIVAWDKLAELCGKFLSKGRLIFVEGRLQTRSYKGQDGIEKTATEVVIDEMVMLDPMPQAVRESLAGQQAY
jgi:single-strand DNA-binding protein